MSIKCFFGIFLSLAMFNTGISNAKLNQSETIVDTIETNALDRFVKEKSEEIVKSEKYDYEKYPWLHSKKFKNTPLKIAKLIVKRLLSGETDWLKKDIESKTPKSPSYENNIVAYYILTKMINEKLSIQVAIDKVRNELLINKIISKKDIDSRISDIDTFLNAARADEIIKKTNKTNLLVEFKNFLEPKKIETVDYTKPLSKDNLSIKYDLPKLDPKDEKTALYGIYSTRQNYESGKYVSYKGDSFLLNKVSKAKNMWEILGIENSIGDMNSLNSTLEKKLRKIHSGKETKVIVFKGTCQDAIIRSSQFGKVAIVNFANGETITGGTLLGKNGQEEALVHCIPGLYESLLENSKNPSDNTLSRYTDVYQSPEVGLYTENAKLIKRFINGVFFTLEKPIDINVISSAAINFGKTKGYENNWFIEKQNLQTQDPYIDIRRRIRMQLATAILAGNDVFITGLFGCGRYNANKSKISEIYQEELKNPLFKNKLKLVVLTVGDADPYSNFGF